MDLFREHQLLTTRRHFFGKSACGLGTAALASLLNPQLFAATPSANGQQPAAPDHGGILDGTHFPAKAKRVIYLFMSGAPSQLDTFDYKPTMDEWFDKDLPESIRQGQRLTTMTSGQARFPIAPSMFNFAQHGSSGAWVSELLPHTASVVDDLCFVKSMHTEAINHDPAITYIQTGSQIPGRPSLGAWLSYGLGSMNDDLPTFVVLHSSWTGRKSAQALYERLWGTGWLPSEHAGVSLRSKGDPVLFLSDPPGVTSRTRRQMLDALSALNQQQYEAIGDPEINTRIQQYEMAYRMQSSVPEPGRLLRRDAGDARYVRTRSPHARHVRRQLPARPPDGRTQRPVHADLHSRLGPARQSAGRSAQTVPRRRPGECGPDQRPQTAGPARRHARHLGRRVRPHDLLSGQADPKKTTAATIIRAASRSGWPAAASNRG